MFATQVLPQSPATDDSEEENASEIVGYIIVDDKKYEVKKGETKIGRDFSMCSVVIENFTLSKVHAVIESDGIKDTFIYDTGSTNQTKLGKKVLKPHCRYKLDNESKLKLGNVTAKFILPPDKGRNPNVNTKKNSSMFINPLEELGDIFDLATQVTVSEPSTSGEPVIFEKNNDTVYIFKNQNSVFPSKLEKPPRSLRCIFNEATQCKLESEKHTSRAEYQDRLFESSGIFSLNTQCQLYESSGTQEDKCATKEVHFNKNPESNESDKIKSLLNDGQDDVLCTFMSLHSPKGQNDRLPNEVKVKTEVENLSQVLNNCTQMQDVIVQVPSDCNAIRQKNLIENKYLNEEFSRSPCEPSIASTPFNQRFKINCARNASEMCGSSIHIEKDFMKIQELTTNGLSSTKKNKSSSHNLDSLSDDEETQLYLEKTVNDSSTIEQKNVVEDFILTQTFEVSGSNLNKKNHTVIPESEELNVSDDDFIQTQIFDVEKGKIYTGVNVSNSERPNSDVDHQLNDTVNLTQRNNQDDFIETQIFEEKTSAPADLEINNSNDEDFICTQPVQLSVIKAQPNRNFQNRPFQIEAASRESSPDLLDAGGHWKNTEDHIATQIFEVQECQKPSAIISEVVKRTSSSLFSHFEAEKNDCNITRTKEVDIIDSSGDETESDLEILLEKSEIGENKKFGQSALNSFKVEPESEDSAQRKCSTSPESNSNSSYIFGLEAENHSEQVNDPNQRPTGDLSDSDSTDCEEVALVYSKISSVKQEPSNEFEPEDTQVLTLTLPDDFVERRPCPSDDWMIAKESPKFEIENENYLLSPLSLEMPNTQDIETTVNRFQSESEKEENFDRLSKVKKLEVGINSSEENNTFKKFEPSERQVDSPLKRPLCNITTDVVPHKKSKIETLDRFLISSEKQFLKLVQTHDIAQIQPSRTRNSLKAFTTENKSIKSENYLGNNITNERRTSRRKVNTKRGSTKKINGDITSFLTRKMEIRRSLYGGRKKETSPKEKKEELMPVESSSRTLRSSRRNYEIAGPTVLAKSPTRNLRRSKRNSRNKNADYFSSSCVNVVFTGFDCESLDKVIYDLGGKKTNDLMCSEVVVADKIRRTVKLLCAVGLSLPITSPDWLLSCKKEKKFLNPWNYILRDEESEEKWGFNLKTSLERSKKVKLLQGFNVFATKNIQPPVKDLLVIVECCGGNPLSTPPEVWPKNTIVVSCLEDKKWWPLAKRNLKIVHYEFILSGVLKQKIDFKTYKLR